VAPDNQWIRGRYLQLMSSIVIGKAGGSFVVNLGELLAGKVGLSSVFLLSLLLENDVLRQLWYNVIVVVLVLELDLEEALVLVVHGAVHLRQVDRRVGVVLLDLLTLWHFEWRHTLGKDSTDLVLLLVLHRDFDVVVLLDFGGDLLLVGLNSVVEVVSVVLVASLKVDVLVELFVVHSLEGRLVLCLCLLSFGLVHLVLKFVGLLVDLVVPGLVVLFVGTGGGELNIVVLLDFVQVWRWDLLSLGVITLLINHFLSLLNQVGHEF